jgi:hypothetical protein
MMGLQGVRMNLKPAQAGVMPLQTPQQIGFDINSIVNLMLMMMAFIMPIQMMGGMFSSEEKKKSASASVEK